LAIKLGSWFGASSAWHELCVLVHCLARCVYWQQSSTVVDKTRKETANVVHRIHFNALINKVESSLANKTHAS